MPVSLLLINDRGPLVSFMLSYMVLGYYSAADSKKLHWPTKNFLVLATNVDLISGSTVKI